MLGPCANLLTRAWEILRRDELRAFTHMVDALGPLTVALEVDDEVFSVLGGDRLSVQPGLDAAAAVRVRASRAAVLRLIDGEASFLDAVFARDIRLTGATPDLMRLARAQRAFTEGAIRARRMRPLIAELRAV